MRQSGLKIGGLHASGEDRQLLVLGYHGTLQPDPYLCIAGSWSATSEGGVCVGSPPQMEALIEPLVGKAMLGLELRMPSRHRVFGGELISVDLLLEFLRERLRGILTLTVAACLERGEVSTAAMERYLRVEYPRLYPLLEHAISDWVAATTTFHERLHRDEARLAKWLGFARLPPVESVAGTASDTHPGGHGVLRVVFKGGLRVYYKPRSISGEWLWHRLLEMIAEMEPALRLQAGRVLEGSTPARYGWAESVLTQCDMDGRAGGSEYWHAAGAVLCLAHHVSMTDLHLGNLLATQNGPAITDAECLGVPRLVDVSGHGTPRVGEAITSFLKSLMNTGLLPDGVIRDVPDVSGLFGAAGAVPSLGLPRWIVEPNGHCGLVAAPAALLDHGNAPGKVSMLAALPDLLAGYRHAAGVLLCLRKVLTSPGSRWRSVLERCHAPRIVVRDTLGYSLLLSRSLEPRYLLAGDQRRSDLRRVLGTNAPAAFPKALVRAELNALLRLHVPRLIALPGTRTLASGSGRPLVRNFARCTPAEEVILRMEALTAEKLETVHIPALLLAMLRSRGACTGTGECSVASSHLPVV